MGEWGTRHPCRKKCPRPTTPLNIGRRRVVSFRRYAHGQTDRHAQLITIMLLRFTIPRSDPIIAVFPSREFRGVGTAGVMGALAPAMLKPRGREYLFAPEIFSHIFACCSLNFHSLSLCCRHTIKTSHSVGTTGRILRITKRINKTYIPSENFENRVRSNTYMSRTSLKPKCSPPQC